ncbi:MAG: PH domain-containing protein [Muribaculaceae bacterium]|nr:PH domain-containing protein [Muribaculaceae bacterium]
MDKYGQMSKWDGSMIILSVGVILVLSLLSWLVEDYSTYFLVIIAVYTIVLALTLTAMWFVPLEVSVSNTFFRINFPMRRRIIGIDRLRAAKVFDNKKGLRLRLGSRRFFGWWGIYMDSAEGRIYVYASNLNQLVLVEMKDGSKFLISCSDARTMANCIESRIDTKSTR